jgi:chemotaxis protein MotB
MASQRPELEPIIIIKKKASHGGHHGGAWKVAYADFVTAMMALFIVLWLMNSNEDVKNAVGGYFKDPLGTGTQTGTKTAGQGEGIALSKDDMNKLKDRLETALKQAPQLEKLKEQVEMTVTGEGLRIELMESEHGTFFASGNAKPTGAGEEMLSMLSAELGKLKNKILAEGHTDSKPFAPGAQYTNWELSSDRANAARRHMLQHGIREDQFAEVRGYADQRLRKPEDPANASNRRVSLIVKWAEAPHGDDGSKSKPDQPAQHAKSEKPPSSH